jgi:hypothetical protein
VSDEPYSDDRGTGCNSNWQNGVRVNAMTTNNYDRNGYLQYFVSKKGVFVQVPNP